MCETAAAAAILLNNYYYSSNDVMIEKEKLEFANKIDAYGLVYDIHSLVSCFDSELKPVNCSELSFVH